MKKQFKKICAASLLALTLGACDNSSDSNNNSPVAAPTGDESATAVGAGGQVERLARPAINEGLIISNNLLNTFNIVAPTVDLSEAAAPVRAEAASVITAADMIDGKKDVTVEAVVTAFLPDVMRIDTRKRIPAGKTAYNADVSGDRGMLTGGRKLEDDVMDITLSFLVAGDASGKSVSDGVSYAGVQGNPNQMGHKLLVGQTRRGGAARFPFVPEPH